MFGISISMGAVRVAGSSTGDTRAMRPVNVSPGYASTCTRVALPVSSSLRSFSTTLATSRTRVMSTTSATGAFCETKAPGSTLRFDDESVHRRGNHGVREVDTQLVEAGLRCVVWARARSSCASAAW